ncbi:alpha/beta-hydrolase [Trichoderma sp. SZMC 28011]
MVSFSCLLAALLPVVGAASINCPPSNTPAVKVKNGTVVGKYNAHYQQDLFLGIPYAKPPIQDLRFTRPQHLTEKWTGPKQATEYGPYCYGFNVGLVGYDTNTTNPSSEDCLTINVVRPHNYRHEWASKGLPVLVWVYGGGFQEGGSADTRYNMSRLVEISTEMGKPVIGVSFNYRMNAFGFISGEPFNSIGATNLGLHDQRLALRWIQENIASFGGDPSRVTLQGESAGALSISLNMLVHKGRDEGLFQRAILESGTPLFAHSFPNLADQKEILGMFLNRTECSSSKDIVSCLRKVSAEDFIKAATGIFWHPIIDNDLLSQLSSESIKRGDFLKIPLLIGTNTNEGSTFLEMFSQGSPVNTFDDVSRVLLTSVFPHQLPNGTIARLHELYSDVMKNPSDAVLGTVLPNPGPAYGKLHGELSLLVGDSLFTAGRRVTCQAWAQRNIPAYSFRFDTNPAGLSPEVYGAAHFQEVPFVFDNINGEGYDVNPFDVNNQSLKRKYLDLAQLMTRMWLSFVHTGDPNNHGVHGFNLRWPKYDIDSPLNIVFNATKGITLEKDTYRAKAMSYIWESAAIFHR